MTTHWKNKLRERTSEPTTGAAEEVPRASVRPAAPTPGPLSAAEAVRRMVGALAAPTGSDAVAGAVVDHETRVVYLVHKLWGDMTAGDEGVAHATGVVAEVAVDIDGAPYREVVTRTRYKQTPVARGRWDPALKALVVGQEGGSHRLYCSSLTVLFTAAYHGLRDVDTRLAWFSCDHVYGRQKLDWAPHKVGKGVEANPLAGYFERVDRFKKIVTTTGTSTAGDLVVAHITREHRSHDEAKQGRLGDLYVYSLEDGFHTGVLMWFRGAVWKLAADGTNDNPKGLVCGPYRTASSKHDREGPVTLYRIRRCDVHVPPLALVLDETQVQVKDNVRAWLLARTA